MKALMSAPLALLLLFLSGCVTVLICNDDQMNMPAQIAIVSEGEDLGPDTTLADSACRTVTLINPGFIRVNAVDPLDPDRSDSCTIPVSAGDTIEVNWDGTTLTCTTVATGM